MSKFHKIQGGLCVSCSKRCAPPEEAAYVPDNVTMFTVTFYNDKEIIKLGVCGEYKPLFEREKNENSIHSGSSNT